MADPGILKRGGTTGADPGLTVGGGGLNIPCAKARAKFYVLRPLLDRSRGGSRIGLRGGLSISRALARAKFYVLRPLLTSFPHTSYTKKK